MFFKMYYYWYYYNVKRKRKKLDFLQTGHLTLPSGRTGISCPALRSYLFDPVRISDLTVGHNSRLDTTLIK